MRAAIQVNELKTGMAVFQSFIGVHDPSGSYSLLPSDFEVDIHEILKTRLNFNFVVPQFSDKIENSAPIVSTRPEKN